MFPCNTCGNVLQQRATATGVAQWAHRGGFRYGMGVFAATDRHKTVPCGECVAVWGISAGVCVCALWHLPLQRCIRARHKYLCVCVCVCIKEIYDNFILMMTRRVYK